MKIVLCVVVISSMLAQGAALTKIVDAKPLADSQANLVIHEFPATVFDIMMSKGIIAIQDSQPDILKSSIGQTYLMINRQNGVRYLNSLKEVVKQVSIYKTIIEADRCLQASATRIKSFTTEDNNRVIDRVIALAEYDTIYSMLQKKLIEKDIPEFQLCLTAEDTIKENGNVVLSDSTKTCFLAVQLSLALNLQEQYALDQIAFMTLFKNYIPNEAPVTSTGWLNWFGR